MTDVAAAGNPEETLAWEAAQRTRAGAAGIAAGVLLLVATGYGLARLGNTPKVTLTDGLRDALGQPPAQGPRGLLTPAAMYLSDHEADVIITSILTAIGTALIAVVLGFLFRATQARNPAIARLAIYAALIGPLLYAVGPLLSGIGVASDASSYVSRGVFSTLAAHDALRSGSLYGVGSLLTLLGQLLTALAFVLVSLNAMRVGLLTRFLGILGVVSGALVIFPIGGTPIIVECFWLAFVGMMILGRGRTAPPAWQTGRAEPWPTQQQLAEQRDAAAGKDAVTDRVPARPVSDDGDGVAVAAPPVARRKRKRR